MLPPRGLGYALCNVAIAFGLLPVNLLLLYYFTQIAGIPAGIAGTIIALPKLWDALIDPAFGGWVDQISIRIGRRAPAVAISSIVFAATLVGIFALPADMTAFQIAVMGILLLVLSSIAQTAIGVSQFAIATEMTTDPVKLSALLATATIAAQILCAAGAPVLPLLVSATGGGRRGYAMMAVIVAVIVLVGMFIFILSTRNVPLTAGSNGSQAIPIGRSLRKTVANSSFYNLIGLVVCLNSSIVIQLGFLPFANQYVLKGTAGTLAVLEGVLGVSVLAGMMFSPWIAKRFDALTAMLFSNGAVVVAMIFLVAAAYAPLAVTLVGMAIVGLGSGVVGVLIQTTILEAAQKKLPDGTVVALGFYLGIMVASIKLGSSAGAFVSGQALQLIGFVNGAAVQSAQAMVGMRMGYTLMPCLFVILGTFCLYRSWARRTS